MSIKIPLTGTGGTEHVDPEVLAQLAPQEEPRDEGIMFVPVMHGDSVDEWVEVDKG